MVLSETAAISGSGSGSGNRKVEGMGGVEFNTAGAVGGEK